MLFPQDLALLVHIPVLLACGSDVPSERDVSFFPQIVYMGETPLHVQSQLEPCKNIPLSHSLSSLQNCLVDNA